MKKTNLLIYYILFIIYEELIFSCLIYKTFPTSLWLIILFSIPIAIVFNIISSLFKEKINRLITAVMIDAIVIAKVSVPLITPKALETGT